MPAKSVPLPVQGALDTSSPVSSRPPGALVEAADAHVQYWGPRGGFTQRTWVYRAPASGYPNPQCPVFDGSSGYGYATMLSKQQFNLPTRWTLDVVLRPSGVSHSSDLTVPVFQWWLDGFAAFGIYLGAGGASSGAQRLVTAKVTPSSSPGVAGTTTTIVGATQLSVGTAVENTHHLRLVRDGADFALYVDGSGDASSSSVSATQRHEAGVSPTLCAAYMATAHGVSTGGNHLYAGRVMRATLRTGAASDATKGMRDFQFPKAAGVRLAAYGRMISAGLGQREESQFGADWTWSGATFEDVTEPAAWWTTSVQGGAYFVDGLGRPWNVVMAGGTLYARRVG